MGKRRRTKKAERQIRAEMQAEENIAKDEAKKAEKQARREKNKAEWEAKTPEEKKSAYKIMAGVVAVVVVVIALIASCGGSGSDQADEPAPAAPASLNTDGLIGANLEETNKARDDSLKAVALTKKVFPESVGGGSIWDESNWTIIAYCDRLTDNKYPVGVIKSDRMEEFERSALGENFKGNELSSMVCGDGDQGQAGKAEPVTEPTPHIAGYPLTFAASKFNLNVKPVDLGAEVVDDVPVGEKRGVLDQGNWQIIGYCPTMTDRTVTVGVIKRDEYSAIMPSREFSGMLEENFFQYALDCKE